MNKEIVLACDLGGTNLRMAAVTAGGQILHRVKVSTPQTQHARDVVQAIVESAETCRQFIKTSGDNVRIKSVAAAVPATVSVENGVVLKAPNVPALDGFRLAATVSNELDLPCILENDANAAAIGEHSFGAAQGFDNAVMVMLGTGVGGGIIINGKILRGADGTAGEIGHICVEPFGAPCGCGSRGCLEQYSSATAIVRLAQELENQYPKTILKSGTKLTSADIFQAGKEGDELALEVFRQMGFYLGIALADLVNVLNPDVIVIGGGASAGWELFIGQIREQIHSRSFREPAERVKVVRARLGDDAGILGAACIGFMSPKNKTNCGG